MSKPAPKRHIDARTWPLLVLADNLGTVRANTICKTDSNVPWLCAKVHMSRRVSAFTPRYQTILKPCSVSNVIPRPTKTANDHQPKRMCLLASREPESNGVGVDFVKVMSVPVEVAECVGLSTYTSVSSFNRVPIGPRAL